ncbi:MAG: ribonuclease J [candidate division WWE3 bacterium]|nr:ribonuclease J [candidate division WWE3 bacterium]
MDEQTNRQVDGQMNGRVDKPNRPIAQSSSYLRFIPFGGVGEVTRNLYLYETPNDLVAVDCGIGFPPEEEGRSENELLIPDFSYLIANQRKLRALLITHGHEDHIGAIPYLLKKVRVPVFAARLPAGMIREKLRERGPKSSKGGSLSVRQAGASGGKFEIREVDDGQRIKLGRDFSFEFIRLTHSIPDTMAIALSTPLGVVIHTGDFKLDPTPLDRRLAQLGKIEEFGRRGVLLLASDSLRADREGSCPSERIVGEAFFHEIPKTRGRVFITMFSSDVSRIQQAVDVAAALGREVTLAGLSLEKNFNVARDLGYLAVPKKQVISNEKLKKLPVSQQLILVSGSQGQSNSALAKMARGEHRAFKIGQGDLVIFSSDLIPGNEGRVRNIQDDLRGVGAKVLYLEEIPEIHVSGHAYAEDLKRVLRAAQAQYLVPIGGTPDSMREYAKMARGFNYHENQIFLLEAGQILEFYPFKGKAAARLAGRLNLREFSVLQD